MRTKPNGVMSFTAPCARAQRAEISRRFGAPQMAESATNRFRNLRSPESVGAIRKSGRAHSASAQGLRFPADSGYHRWLAERGGVIDAR